MIFKATVTSDAGYAHSYYGADLARVRSKAHRKALQLLGKRKARWLALAAEVGPHAESIARAVSKDITLQAGNMAWGATTCSGAETIRPVHNAARPDAGWAVGYVVRNSATPYTRFG